MMIKYLSYAIYAASLSKALNKAVGACLVPMGSDVPILGYNGPPRGIKETNNWDRFTEDEHYEICSEFVTGKETEEEIEGLVEYHHTHTDPRYLMGYKSGNGLKYQIDVHAEANTIYNAARAGVSTIGASLYLTCPLPCKECV